MSDKALLLFLLVVTRTTTEGARTGIQWSLTSQLHELDFADDIALLSHSCQHAQAKVQSLASTAKLTGLNIKKSKTNKVMRVKNVSHYPITLDNEALDDVSSFTYLGSVISTDGGSERDVQTRIGKARSAFLLLKTLWRSKNLSLKTKLRIFNSNVKAVLLYGA